MADAAELRELDDDEIHGRLAEYRRELLNLRFQLATGQLDNVARVGQVKRDVARAMTLLRDREIALAEGRDASPVPRPARAVRAEPEVVDDAEAEDVEQEHADEPRPARRRSKAKAEVAPEVDEAEADEPDAVAGEEDET